MATGASHSLWQAPGAKATEGRKNEGENKERKDEGERSRKRGRKLLLENELSPTSAVILLLLKTTV